MKKVFYYKNELTDDFAGTDIKRKPLSENHKYFTKNPVWHFFAFLFYRIIATPIGSLFNFLAYRMRIVGKGKLRKYSKEGYFLYGNHTLIPGDALTPTMVAFPKKAHIIVNPDATSVPVIEKVVEMMGAVPIPDDIKNMRAFCKAMDEYAKRNKVVVIYPEAHIWPYYTKIRPFSDISFKYPAKTNKPVFCFTTVYKKGKLLPILTTTVYVDGPFLPSPELSLKENQKKLREEVFAAMTERSKLSTFEKNEYVKVIDEFEPAAKHSENAKPEHKNVYAEPASTEDFSDVPAQTA